VNASSNAFKVDAGLGVYSAAKAALRNLVRTWVLDLKGRGIRVNAISPGRTVTPGLDGLAGQGADPKGFYEYLAGQVPLGRNAQPAENRRRGGVPCVRSRQLRQNALPDPRGNMQKLIRTYRSTRIPG